MDVVILVSGGIDSIVACKIIQKQEDNVLPIFIDYGQLAAEKEWEACQILLEECGLPEAKKVDISGYGKAFSSALTDKEKDITNKDEAFLPGRNLLFLVIAASYAYSKKTKAIAIGLLSEETHIFPDQTEAFVVNANFAINEALGDGYMVLTPLAQFSKNDVMKLAKEYEIPIDKTYSCHSGKEGYCGECIACKEILSTEESKRMLQFGRGV